MKKKVNKMNKKGEVQKSLRTFSIVKIAIDGTPVGTSIAFYAENIDDMKKKVLNEIVCLSYKAIWEKLDFRHSSYYLYFEEFDDYYYLIQEF